MAIQAIVEQPPESENRREAARWRIRLEVPNALDAAQANVVIHDISTAGMLIETRSTMTVGQSIMISLPEADQVVARIVWQDEPLFGCRFEQPLPAAAVSAVRLRSPSREEPVPEVTAPETLPERLRRLRREQGLSRAALCERTGFSKPAIWGWETGRTTPRKDNLLILAGIFGLTEQQLLYGEGHAPAPKPERMHAPSQTETLPSAIAQSKSRIAQAAGVDEAKVHILIAF